MKPFPKSLAFSPPSIVRHPNKKCFLIGAGYIGLNLARALLASGYQPTILEANEPDHPDRGSRQKPWGFNRIAGRSLEQLRLLLSPENSPSQFFDTWGIKSELIGYKNPGILLLAETPGQHSAQQIWLQRYHQWLRDGQIDSRAQGNYELLSSDKLPERFPALCAGEKRFAGAFLSHSDGQCDPTLLHTEMEQRLQRKYGSHIIKKGVTVTRLLRDSFDHVTAIETKEGIIHTEGAPVIITAGNQARRLLPGLPVRNLTLAFTESEPPAGIEPGTAFWANEASGCWRSNDCFLAAPGLLSHWVPEMIDFHPRTVMNSSALHFLQSLPASISTMDISVNPNAPFNQIPKMQTALRKMNKHFDQLDLRRRETCSVDVTPDMEPLIGRFRGAIVCTGLSGAGLGFAFASNLLATSGLQFLLETGSDEKIPDAFRPDRFTIRRLLYPPPKTSLISARGS